MSFSRWLRTNSEHYLLVAAQDQVARRYDARRPRRPANGKDMFWLWLFAPIYRILPWSVRKSVMKRIPGSHRESWPAVRTPAGPAI